MQLPRDLTSGNYKKPDVILCQTDKEKLCKLNVTNLKGTFKFNSYSEISFEVSSVYNDPLTGEQRQTPYYDYIEGLRLVYLEGFGYFQLQDPETYSDGIQEYKSINAYSLEYALSQKYLETFVINKGTTESIDGVVLYNPNDIRHSLLHLVLQKAYGWNIGFVDDILEKQGRSFEVDRESIYDFLTNELCETYKCYIDFDTVNNTVNVYSDEEIVRIYADGESNSFKVSSDIVLDEDTEVTLNGHVVADYIFDTNTKMITFDIIPAKDDIIEITNEFKSVYDTDILISFENLSDEMKVNYSADDIKTQLTVKGADDLDIRAVNFGLPSIINLDYYHTVEWMGQNLYDEYSNYLDKQAKYMTGLYSKNVSILSEESFTINSDKEELLVGDQQTIDVNCAQETFFVNGYSETFGIDQSEEKFDVIINTEVFEEPEMEINFITCADPEVEFFTITAQEELFVPEIIQIDSPPEEIENDSDSESVIPSSSQTQVQNEFTLPEDFVFTNKTIVTVNKEPMAIDIDYTYNESTRVIAFIREIRDGDIILVSTCNTEYIINSTLDEMTKITLNGAEILIGSDCIYDKEMHILTINADISSGDIVEIYTYTTQFNLNFIFDSKSQLYVNDVLLVPGEDYTFAERNNIVVIKRRLTASDAVEARRPNLELVTEFKLEHPEANILSVMIDGISIEDYTIENGVLRIMDNSLTYGNTVVVSSGVNTFKIMLPKDTIAEVKLDNNATGKYEWDSDNNIVTITDGLLFSGQVNTVTIISINTHFILSNYKSKFAAIKVDGNKLGTLDYTFNHINNVLTIPAAFLIDSKLLVVETLDNTFTLSQPREKIAKIRVDGDIIPSTHYDYVDEILTIDESLLTITSSVVVQTIYTHFELQSFNGIIDAVKINGNKTNQWSYSSNTNVLYVNDNALTVGDKIFIETIYNEFELSTTKNKIISVNINGSEQSNYTINSRKLIIPYTNLRYGYCITIESANNNFIVYGLSDKKYTVERRHQGSINSETIHYGSSGYTYNPSTNTLTVYIDLEDKDVIIVRVIDITNALLVVPDSEEDGDGEISISKVAPTLNSYVPSVGDYVVKVEGYTSLLKELYNLIDKKFDAENAIPEYSENNVVEKRLYPKDYENGGVFEEPSVETLGDIYKIINLDSKGNEVSTKYYVCEMRIKVVYDEENHPFNTYIYDWYERNLVFGDSGVNFYREQVDIYTTLCEVQINAGWGNDPENNKNYVYYKETYDKLEEAKAKLKEQEAKVQNIENQIIEINKKIAEISNEININNNFSTKNLEKLLIFLREDEYTDDCFVVTDIDTNSDVINTQKELMVAGQKELKKISKPLLSFSASLKNIYAIPEFEPILYQFELGKFIKIRLKNGALKKSRLLQVDFNFEDFSDFSCDFGDLLMAKDPGDIHADLLKQAVTAGKVVASGSSNWQKGFDMANSIDDKIRQGLIDATTSIKTDSAGQDISWDNYGIHLRRFIENALGERVLDPREGWITNNNFLYSSDNFKTTEAVFGEYKVDGQTYWGLLAKCVMAGFIQGSTIEGGTIKIGQQLDPNGAPAKDDKGNYVYNFEVTPDGEVKMSKGNAAEVLAYFSFDALDSSLIIGNNQAPGYFARLTPERIEFGISSVIEERSSKPTYDVTNGDYKNYEYDTYVCYKYQASGSSSDEPKYCYEYYKMPKYNERVGDIYTDKTNPKNPAVHFGKVFTWFTNSTATMKEAEVEGNLRVGTNEGKYISLGNFNFKLESNGSMSITTM